jgi:predicted small lipoprotein YifL
MTLLRWILISWVIMTISGCGQTGRLYLPAGQAETANASEKTNQV